MAKNTSTPTNPPGSADGQKWQTTTTATATARSPWISGRTSARAIGGAVIAPGLQRAAVRAPERVVDRRRGEPDPHHLGQLGRENSLPARR